MDENYSLIKGEHTIVLLAFNCEKNCPGGVNGSPISFQDLMTSLGLPEDILKRVIHSLACGKYKVLKRVATPSAGITVTYFIL